MFRLGFYFFVNIYCVSIGLKKKIIMKSYRFFFFEKFFFNLSIKNLYNVIILCICIFSYISNYLFNLFLYSIGELDRFILVIGLKFGFYNLIVLFLFFVL